MKNERGMRCVMNIKNIFDDMLIKLHYEDAFIKSNKYMIRRKQELSEDTVD